MKRDCRKTDIFIKELGRLCKSQKNCHDCPVNELLCDEMPLGSRSLQGMKELQKWSNENPEFRVGMKVRVTDKSRCYTTFESFVSYYAPNYVGKYAYGKACKNGTIGTIILCKLHPIEENELYFIQAADETCYLISNEGIEPYEAENRN